MQIKKTVSQIAEANAATEKAATEKKVEKRMSVKKNNGKIYLFGDTMKSHYLLKEEPTSSDIYTDKACVHKLYTGTTLIYNYLTILKEIEKNSSDFKKVFSGYDIPNIIGPCLIENNKIILAKKDEATSFLTLEYDEKSKNSKIARITERSGYRCTENSITRPEIVLNDNDLDNVTFNENDVIIINNKGLGFGQKNGNLTVKLLTKLFVNNKAKKLLMPSNQHFYDYINGITNLKDGTTPITQEDLDRITFITTLDDCRSNKMIISIQRSWEESVTDFYNAYYCSHYAENLRKFKNLIVYARQEGAIIVNGPEFKLIFAPELSEGATMRRDENFVEGIPETTIVAYLYALCAGSTDTVSNVKFALDMGMEHFKLGAILPKRTDDKDYNTEVKTVLKERVEKYFDKKVVNCFQNNKQYISENFSDVVVPLLGNDKQQQKALETDWSILTKRSSNDETTADAAVKIVVDGPKDFFKTIPVLKIKDLTAIDRKEIERFNTIKILFDEYINSPHGEKQTNVKKMKPISIAVFGPPGSGKSFGIKQILKEYSNERIENKEVNLAQISDVSELNNSFADIADINIRGKIPVVFFDEFDSSIGEEKWGWLKYFLAPMQDGQYVVNGNIRPLGQAIFIFAGATKNTFKDFKEQGVFYAKSEKNEFISAKVPDFLSRLKGYIDIIGINKIDSNDSSYMLRRAVILRDLLARYMESIFTFIDVESEKKCNIEEELLRDLLEIQEFKYGSRSLQQIISMSHCRDIRSFVPSVLPSRDQLNLHVDSEQLFKKKGRSDTKFVPKT
ncbi:MAG: AAA family ATPase [Clostridiales bacterium]|jgi:hypothetical protein|nr:AAA family ATPase [Clostridiales bacterium]